MALPAPPSLPRSLQCVSTQTHAHTHTHTHACSVNTANPELSREHSPQPVGAHTGELWGWTAYLKVLSRPDMGGVLGFLPKRGHQGTGRLE
jgi:hypothetical protein